MLKRFDTRQSETRTALPSIGASANEGLDSILTKLDAATLATQNELNTGFYSWSGSGSYYSITLTNQFNLLRGGSVYILNKLVTFADSQNVTLTTNKTSFIGIDSTGTLVKFDHDSLTASTFENNAMLFEAWFDGTNVTVVKENHPYSFPTAASRYLHNNVGVVIRSIGAVINRVATGTGAAAGDRQIKIVGADTLEDHGLTTTISDSGGSGVTFNFVYKDGSGKWIKYAQQTQVPMVYNNAGTITALGTGPNTDTAILALYISKDDLNSSAPTYYAVIDAAVYNDIASAQAAITAGTFSLSDNELAAIELCQLGYIIIENNGTGGYINTVIVSKATFNSKLIGGGASVTSHLLLSDLTGGAYGDGGHSNLISKVEASVGPTTSDYSYKLGTIWIDTVLKRQYILTDNTVSAAVWQDYYTDMYADFQDRNIRLIKGGIWDWNSGTGVLSWSANAYVQAPGVADTANTILAGNTTLSADSQVAYVTLNRTGAGGNLTVSVAAIGSFTVTKDTFIIARRTGTDILIGTDSPTLPLVIPPSMPYKFIAETPVGNIDSSNTAYTIAHNPLSGAFVFLNGLLKEVTTHYTITGKTINFVSAPSTGSELYVIYGTNDKFMQTNLGTGDGSTYSFPIKSSMDTIVTVDGAFARPKTEYTVVDSELIFDQSYIPAVGQKIAMTFNGVAQSVQEALSGTVNGSNTVFTFSTPPTATGAVIVAIDGIIQEQGVDYTIVSNTVTFTTAPVYGQSIYGSRYNG